MSKELIPAMEGELLIFPVGAEGSGIRVLLSGETVWLTQAQMGELFQTNKQNIAKHLKAIFSERELEASPVVNQWLTTATLDWAHSQYDAFAERGGLEAQQVAEGRYVEDLRTAAKTLDLVSTPKSGKQGNKR